MGLRASPTVEMILENAMVPAENLIRNEGDGFTGFVHQALIDNYLSDVEEPEEIEFYFCGPPMMNQAVIKMTSDFGIPDENVSFDDFGG